MTAIKAMIFFLCTLCISEAVPGQQASLIHTEHQWLRAIGTHDTAFLKTLLADDFIDVAWNGHVRHKADIIRSPAVPGATQQLSALQVRTYGNTGIVNGINTVHLPKTDHVVRVRFTDVFYKRQNTWCAVSLIR
ncbi:MAG TPA: nuclear transport factor 2 family protein [Chitinophagaceae bacterium]|nr:nuclear transport factor 2 family protein [Chitinophagaceae bacterium]